MFGFGRLCIGSLLAADAGAFLEFGFLDFGPYIIELAGQADPGHAHMHMYMYIYIYVYMCM